MNKEILNQKIIELKSNRLKKDKQKSFISALNIIRKFDDDSFVHKKLTILINEIDELIKDDNDFCIKLVQQDKFIERESDFFEIIYFKITNLFNFSYNSDFKEIIFNKKSNHKEKYDERKYLFFNLYLNDATNYTTEQEIYCYLQKFFKDFDKSKIKFKFDESSLTETSSFNFVPFKIKHNNENELYLNLFSVFNLYIFNNLIIEDKIKINYYNTNHERITEKAPVKLYLSMIFASLFDFNCNIPIFNDLFKCNKYQEHFEKIDFYIANNNYYLGLKEAILFLEGSLRDKIFEENLNVIDIKTKEIEDEFYKFKYFLNKKKYIFNETLFNNELLENLNRIKNQEIIYQNLSLKDILIILKENSKINEENYIFLNYILLNDNNDGFDLRNKIFHGFFNFTDFINIYNNKEIAERIMLFFIFYIIFSSYLIINR